MYTPTEVITLIIKILAVCASFVDQVAAEFLEENQTFGAVACVVSLSFDVVEAAWNLALRILDLLLATGNRRQQALGANPAEQSTRHLVAVLCWCVLCLLEKVMLY